MSDQNNTAGQSAGSCDNSPNMYAESSLARTWVKTPAPSRRCQGRCPWIPLAAAILLIWPLMHRSYSPWRIPGPPPIPQSSQAEPLQMVGTWVGEFGQGHKPTLLAVTDQRGSIFDGVMVSRASYGSFRVRVQGSILENGGIRIEETQTYSHPLLVGWALGTDTGFMMADGMYMAGAGSDTAGQTYRWHFQHRSMTTVIPQD